MYAKTTLEENSGIFIGTFRLSHVERFIFCALTIQYNIYSAAGRSISSVQYTILVAYLRIMALHTSVNVAPGVV